MRTRQALPVNLLESGISTSGALCLHASPQRARALRAKQTALGRKGHSHTEFLTWWQRGVPTRLLIWRDGRPFDADEQTAILRAAARELSWAAAGSDAGYWKIRLVPLDEAVPPPPGFDETLARTWESITPYVPSRHHLRGGKPRPSQSLVLLC